MHQDPGAVRRRWLFLFLAMGLWATTVTYWSPMAFAQEGSASESAPADSGEQAPDNDINMLVYTWQASPTFFIIMGIMSVYLVTLVVNQFMKLKLQDVMPPHVVANLDVMLGEKKYKEAYELLHADKSLFGRSLAAGVERLSHGFDRGMEAMIGVADEGKLELDQKNSQIAVIAQIAPMLGLLGTVIGMILSFQEIAKGGQPKPAELANNIGLALITTLEGLVVAIPAPAFFSLFKNRITRMMVELESVSESYLWRFSAALKK